MDAWLRFDPSSRPQPEVHRRNGPRLAAALVELPDVEISDLGPSRYAVVAGLTVDNHRDLDDLPVPVLAEGER
ncbi:hypothetical protein [Actinoplanes sp. NPDC049265]|uniref:hypothetical protein n=1 Tax=Actinoplanes sp. NPDC049265 TaxID=3363902 RepID=UPI00371D5CB8